MNYPEYLTYISKHIPDPYPTDRRERCKYNAEEIEAALGLAGETGEVVDLIKKSLFYGQPIDQLKLLNELGDCLFYLTRLADLYHFSMATVMDANVEKLKARYPNGYSNEAAITRKDLANG
jgi:NTP pyrophosphatase (non-canonical NTP hydrolase)